MIPENNSIKYRDFINHVSKLADYDNSHIIISITEDVIKKLISKYNVDMITNNKKDGGIYYGTKFEHSNNHLNKIKTLNLQIDELAAYNHLAIYLRWCYEHELLTKEISSLIKEQKDDLRKLISSSAFNGGLYSSHFNELGKVFTKEFYSGKSIGYYPQCIDFYAKRFFGEEKYNSAEFKDEAYLFIPYDETYYQGLSKYIDKAWHDFMVKYKIS